MSGKIDTPRSIVVGEQERIIKNGVTWKEVVHKINNSGFQATRVIFDFSHLLQWMHYICC